MTTPAVTATDSLSPIAARFASLREQGRMALMPFLMAGDPDLSTTAEVLLSLQAQGADMVELGIPYSDPLADGPVIQASAYRALSAGTTPDRVLDMLAGLKGQLTIPVILFTYSNPLLNRGAEQFFADAAAAGAAGMVIPDLPLEEAERRDVKGLYKKARSGQLKNFTGIDSPYEAPERPEIRIDTTRETPEDAAERIVERVIGSWSPVI